MKAEMAARKAHAGSVRKGSGEPFFEHSKRVAIMMISSGASQDAVAAAYLHDVVEDTESSIGQFSSRVRAIVQHLTVREGEAKIDHIERIGRVADPEVFLIKVADRIDNLRDGGKAFGRRWLEGYLVHSRRLYELAQEKGLSEHPLVRLLGKMVLK